MFTGTSLLRTTIREKIAVIQGCPVSLLRIAERLIREKLPLLQITPGSLPRIAERLIRENRRMQQYLAIYCQLAIQVPTYHQLPEMTMQMQKMHSLHPVLNLFQILTMQVFNIVVKTPEDPIETENFLLICMILYRVENFVFSLLQCVFYLMCFHLSGRCYVRLSLNVLLHVIIRMSGFMRKW